MATAERATNRQRRRRTPARSSTSSLRGHSNNVLGLKPTVQRNLALWVTVSGLPLCILHLLMLWQTRPHYRLFPIYVGAILVALILRLREVPRLQPPRRLNATTFGLLGISIILQVLAFLFYSPLFAYLAFLVCLPAMFYLAAGAQSANLTVPCSAALLLLIPLPNQIEQQLQSSLQASSAQGTSLLLDSMHIEHSLVGTSLNLRGGQFLIEQACSGVSSLFALAAISMFVCLLIRAGWLFYLMAIASSLLVALVGNSLRISSTVVAHEWFAAEIDPSVQHATEGVLFAGIEVIILLSVLGFLRFLFAGIKGPLPVSATVWKAGCKTRVQFSRNPLVTLWNFAFDGQYSSFRWFKDPCERANHRADSNLSNRPQGISPVFAWGLVIASSFLLVMQLSVAMPSASAVTLVEPLQPLGESTLPQSLSQWKLTSYELETRDRRSEWGSHSETWVYKSPNQQEIVISCSFPFYDWHELTRCYRNLGCIVDDYSVSHDESLGDIVNSELVDPSGTRFHLTYLYVDYSGSGIRRPLSLVPDRADDRLHERAISFVGRQVGTWLDQPRLQIQVLSPADSNPSVSPAILSEVRSRVVSILKSRTRS